MLLAPSDTCVMGWNKPYILLQSQIPPSGHAAWRFENICGLTPSQRGEGKYEAGGDDEL